jgi:hypothetical protein
MNNNNNNNMQQTNAIVPLDYQNLSRSTSKIEFYISYVKDIEENHIRLCNRYEQLLFIKAYYNIA